MDAPQPAPAQQGPGFNTAAKAPSSSTATSQAFHHELAEPVLVRCMVITGVGSTIGMIMFGVVQGTVFNFFMEDLSLKERLPWFAGLQWLAGVGSLLGSWIQERWGFRRTLMFVCCGLSRVIWLLVGLMPLVWPEKIAGGKLFGWLSLAIVLFYFIHSVGANAWLTWMSDLVPPRHQGRFWSIRQVFTTGSSAVSRLAFGAYLEQHRSMKVYAIILGISALAGLLDVASYFFVAHRRPWLVLQRKSLLAESMKRLRDIPFRRLCGVYLLWNAANLIMAPTVYYFMREQVRMGPYSISLCLTISLVGYSLASLYWGNFSSREGHRRGLIACLIIQNACTLFYWLCTPGSTTMATVASTLENIGMGGVNLLMFPMLIDYTKGKGGGRAVGMAAFSVLMSIVGFAACIFADRHMYNWTADAFNFFHGTQQVTHQSLSVYLAIMVLAFALRGAALGLALLLPPCERQMAAGPGTLILRRMSEGPLRAAQAMFTSVTGRPEEPSGRGRAEDEGDK